MEKNHYNIFVTQKLPICVYFDKIDSAHCKNTAYHPLSKAILGQHMYKQTTPYLASAI